MTDLGLNFYPAAINDNGEAEDEQSTISVTGAVHLSLDGSCNGRHRMGCPRISLPMIPIVPPRCRLVGQASQSVTGGG